MTATSPDTNQRKLTPAQLRSVHAVLDTGHPKLAARQLNLSVSTVVNDVRNAQVRLGIAHRLLMLLQMDRERRSQAEGQPS